MKTCPYCKIAFDADNQPTKKCVCRNCRFYAEAEAQQTLERREIELMKVHGTLPWQWYNMPEYQPALESLTMAL